jgi:hypothetical protein
VAEGGHERRVVGPAGGAVARTTAAHVGLARLRAMNVTCTQCGMAGLQLGYILDLAQGGGLYARWLAGPLELGSMGGVKKLRRKPKWRIDAFRCPQCGHLELFAGGQPEY